MGGGSGSSASSSVSSSQVSTVFAAADFAAGSSSRVMIDVVTTDGSTPEFVTFKTRGTDRTEDSSASMQAKVAVT